MNGPIVAPVMPAGWEAGTPAHVTDATLRIDRRVCNRLRCPRCRNTGLNCNPVHQGRSYRVFATCPTCDYQTEV